MVSKNKLLGKGAKNPFAAYSSSCSTCKTKTEQGRKYCHRCAYKANGAYHILPPLLLVKSRILMKVVACAVCGKSQNKEKSSTGAPVIQGQKFSAK